MVATLLGLKLRLVAGDLKRSTGRLVMWIIFGVYALFMTGLLLLGLGVAAGSVAGHEASAAALSVVVGSLLVTGWTLLPLVFFGSDQTLDPARFASFPLAGRALAPGLVLAGVVGVPGVVTALVSLGGALPWLFQPAALLAGLVGGGLGLLMTQVGCRLAATAFSGALSSRKARDLTGVIGLIVILLLSMGGYAISVVTTMFSGHPDRLNQVMAVIIRAGAVLSWTPLGAPWALAGDVGQGEWALAGAHLVLAVLYLWLGLRFFAAVLDRALATPARTVSATGTARTDSIARAAGWFWARGRLVPVAAIAARCLRYWRRDPRYLAAIPSMLLMPILFVGMARTMPAIMAAGDASMPGSLFTGMEAFGVGFMALMAGYSLSADVASDSTAWWLHLATGCRGWQDRLGRVIGQAVWATWIIVAVAVVVPLVESAPGRIPAVIGACLALYLAGLGVSAVASSLIIYPVALPGESPLAMKTGMMGAQTLSQFGSMLVSGVLALPVCIWAIFATGASAWLVLLAGVVWGGGVLAGGVGLGGRIMDARGPAILAALRKNDSRAR